MIQRHKSNGTFARKCHYYTNKEWNVFALIILGKAQKILKLKSKKSDEGLPLAPLQINFNLHSSLPALNREGTGKQTEDQQSSEDQQS